MQALIAAIWPSGIDGKAAAPAAPVESAARQPEAPHTPGHGCRSLCKAGGSSIFRQAARDRDTGSGSWRWQGRACPDPVPAQVSFNRSKPERIRLPFLPAGGLAVARAASGSRARTIPVGGMERFALSILRERSSRNAYTRGFFRRIIAISVRTFRLGLPH